LGIVARWGWLVITDIARADLYEREVAWLRRQLEGLGKGGVHDATD